MLPPCQRPMYRLLSGAINRFWAVPPLNLMNRCAIDTVVSVVLSM